MKFKQRSWVDTLHDCALGVAIIAMLAFLLTVPAHAAQPAELHRSKDAGVCAVYLEA